MPDHQQAAIEAVIAEVKEHSWLTVPDEGSECACGFALTEFPLEYAGDAYWQHVASCLIAAAEPHLRKQVRAEVAAEIRASLPRDLAASAQYPDGWFSDMTGDLDIVVEVDEDMVPVGYGFELEAAAGTIDLHHLADIAARIAEGVDHA